MRVSLHIAKNRTLLCLQKGMIHIITLTLNDKIYLVMLAVYIILNANWYLTLFIMRLEDKQLKKNKDEIYFFVGEQGTGKKIPAEVLSEELLEKNLTSENNMI